MTDPRKVYTNGVPVVQEAVFKAEMARLEKRIDITAWAILLVVLYLSLLSVLWMVP